MSFKDLGLSEHILKAIDDCGYDTPTPIQAEAIPHALMMRDVVGLAQTGTGKTASFTLPMIEILSGGRAKARMPRSLILTPTRELAAQIAENFDTYGKYTKLEKALLVGGVSMDEQIKKLDRGVDVLIATPGRMLDLFERGRILMTDIKLLVIDEADRMLDMGFIPDIEKIVSLLSPMRQTLLFSATMPPEIRKLTEKFLNNPREVRVAQTSSASKQVKQHLVWTDKRSKRQALVKIIDDEQVQNAFIFCNRKRDISGVRKYLEKTDHAAGEIHGDMDQKARTETLNKFKNEEITLLVCSDVVARGIDVDDVSHVLNYDVPFNAEDYVHRIGRTGRAGNEGHAWTLAVKGPKTKGGDSDFISAIEKLLKKEIEVVSLGDDKNTKGDKRSKGAKTTKSSKNDKSSQKNKNDAKPEPVKPRGPVSQDPKAKTAPANYEEGISHAPEENNSKSGKSRGGKSGVQGFGEDVPEFFGNG